MHPARRRRMSSAASTRLRRAGRAGFTLVEMLISVTLVLLMMLMFAEIYGIAQQTMSTQRGIAENDQKARILSEVMRRDLATRTFRSVYPFRLEPNSSGLLGRKEDGQAFATVNDVTQELIQLRRGYFSISENHPEVDTDDVLQLTVAADQQRFGRPGDRLYGKATQYPIVPPASGPTPIVEDQPEYDDGVLDNFAGAAGEAEVSYFLRNGNLYRSQLLIRHPYLPPDADGNGSITPRDFPTSYPQFANDFDYSAYRDLDAAGTAYEPRFHGHNATFDSLSNNTDALIAAPYLPPAAENLWFPRILSVPHLRFGHIANNTSSPAYAPPFEHAGGGENFDSVVTATPRTDYFGRFNTFERADADFEYPGTGFKPYDNATPLTDADSDGVIDLYDMGARRGVELMLSNVHSFDIEVWDDIVRDFVNLGHEEPPGENPYYIDPATGAHPVQPGFYHRSRLRRPVPVPDPAAFTPDQFFYYDHSSVTVDVGNRYDTWSPRMFIADGDPTVATNPKWRTGRAPYKPQKLNLDPNIPEYYDPASTTPGREVSMAFGNTALDVDNDGDTVTLLDGDFKESDGEVPLRAIRITIRYLDINSGQTRQTTIEQSLID